MPIPYAPEFRARVLALLRAGKTVRQVATELGLSDATIYNWRRQDEIDTGVRPGLSSPQAAELVAARRRIRELEEEVTILNRAAEKWKPVVPPKERFALIAELADQGCSIQRASRVLDVSGAGFFAWRNRPPSERAIRHAWLTDVIREVHAESFQTYGARRVYAELTLGRGLTVGRGAVELLMGRAGPHGLPGPRKSRLILPKLSTRAGRASTVRGTATRWRLRIPVSYPPATVWLLVVDWLSPDRMRSVGYTIDTRRSSSSAQGC